MGAHVSYITPDSPDAWINIANALQVSKYSAIASGSVAVYDYIVCLDEEIELVWKAQNSLFKYLALLCRYSVIFYITCVVINRLGDYDLETCQKLGILQTSLSVLTVLSSRYVLGLRTAAVYSYRREVCVVIGFVLVLQTVCGGVGSSKWITTPMPPGVAGCFPFPGALRSLNISLYWPPALLTDLVLFTLTICKVFPIWADSQGNSRLSWIVLRDEVLYYALISTLTIATTILMYQKNLGQGPMISPVTLTLSSVLCFHLVLNVRAVGRSPPPSTTLDKPITLDNILAATCMPPPPRNVFRATVVAVEVVSERISEDGEEPMSETNRGSTRSEPIGGDYWQEVHPWDGEAARARKTSSKNVRQTV